MESRLFKTKQVCFIHTTYTALNTHTNNTHILMLHTLLLHSVTHDRHIPPQPLGARKHTKHTQAYIILYNTSLSLHNQQSCMFANFKHNKSDFKITKDILYSPLSHYKLLSRISTHIHHPPYTHTDTSHLGVCYYF